MYNKVLIVYCITIQPVPFRPYYDVGGTIWCGNRTKTWDSIFQHRYFVL